MSTLNDSTTKRLDEIRGSAPFRTPNVRVLAAFSQHTECAMARLGFAARVDFDRLLDKTRFSVPSQQSPFAFQRGLMFENLLRADGYAKTFDLIRDRLGLAPNEGRAVNVRNTRGGAKDLKGRSEATRELLRAMVHGERSAPHLLDGAVLQGVIGGRTAFFEADMLAANHLVRLIYAGEAKSFAKIDDRIDADKLGAAADQLAVYVYLTRQIAEQFDVEPEQVVSDLGLLITPKNAGLTPTLSVKRLTQRINRTAQVLESLPTVDESIGVASSNVSFGAVANQTLEEERRVATLHQVADRVGTSYAPSCLQSCGCARFCRSRAVREGSPCLLGSSAVRQLPQIKHLGRAAELAAGAAASIEEKPVAELLATAGRLIDQVQPTTPAIRMAR